MRSRAKHVRTAVCASIQGALSQGCSPQPALKPDSTLALLLRYRYRLYPTPGQGIAPAQAFGCARVVWNDALALCQNLYQRGEKYAGGAELQKRCITPAKRTAERAWLGDVSASILQPSVRDLDQAFRNWWLRCGNARAPRCKRRHNRQSIPICGKEFRTTDQGVRFPKIGELRLRWSRPLPAVPSSVTIIKDCAGWYVASFVVAVEREPLPPNGKAVGVDPGLASLAVTGDGVEIAPPTFLRAALQRIRRLQRSLSRKVKGANNRATVRFRLATAHATVADQRLDPLHKLSTGLIRENRTVWIEDLNVAGMSRNRKLSKAIADAGWRLLRTLPESKARMDGRTVQVVSRWQPTSRTCSECGYGWAGGQEWPVATRPAAHRHHPRQPARGQRESTSFDWRQPDGWMPVQGWQKRGQAEGLRFFLVPCPELG